MNYFLWELNAKKRRDIKCRKKIVCTRKSNDTNFFQAIFFIFLYQHLKFLVHINNESESVKYFEIFIDKVKIDKNCFGCLFNEYLTIVF
jgi:hypothetical protein